MSLSHFSTSFELPVSAEEAFDWHARPGAFERLLPPWQKMEVIERSGGINRQDRVVLRLSAGPLNGLWHISHCDVIQGRQFCDVQVKGPFKRWRHTHRFEPQGEERCLLTEEIEYELPLGKVGSMAFDRYLRQQLDRLFRYRADVTKEDLALHTRFSERKRLRVAITGSHGFIGSQLSHLLTTGGHEVVRLVRRSPLSYDEARWDVERGIIDTAKVEGIDAIIHLAGENIASGRWSAKRKREIERSRVLGTKELVQSLGRLACPPKTLISVSAVGYYGDCHDEEISERSPPGEGFLAEVAREWEEASQEASKASIHVINPRLGVVLSPAGGALGRMLGPFRMGVGGVLGSGKQWVSWITLDDAISALYTLLFSDLHGPVNLVAPEPVSNQTLTKALGKALGRPTVMKMSSRVIRAVMGEMGEELLLKGARVVPRRLLEMGYPFRHPTLQEALAHLLE